MSSVPSSLHDLPPLLAHKLSTSQIAQLRAYAALLQEANTKVNLVSRKDISHIWEHHIVPSLLFLGWWYFPAGAEVLDIGTGGGLPGIPLAIAHEKTSFVLLDSTRKKIEIVSQIVADLNLNERVKVIWNRAENLSMRFRYIVGRAVAPPQKFLAWCKECINKEGQVFYYTGENFGPIPTGWQGTFHPFGELLPNEPYLQGKGILHLRRKL
ncbi:MAG: 16S rRNA (guanine(527)-N(7))-methyltransferase RsmG [Bacteroidia bacterium]|nr:16S rRNA (guanine(527)-N(7))-methyltransferase RsmG [Bacteroidia bacterium]MDW8134212.1 16S rRNA (guanine(527)-N(7))-methyltransferase RsmG [Bacteroidia bacterium]